MHSVALCEMLCWINHKLELRLLEKNTNSLSYVADTTLMAEKSLLMRVKEESEKVGLKLDKQKTKIMASDPMIDRWGNNGNMTDFIFLGSKITVDGDGSHEIKGRLLLGRKAMTNLGSKLESRDIILCQQRSI